MDPTNTIYRPWHIGVLMPEIISVTELNTRVRDLFSVTPAINDVWVSGEISNLKKYQSGYYFVLKDPTSEIHAVMFNSARARIDFEPKENMKVNVFGSIGMYVPRGTYQFMVASMRQSGIGDRYLAFEALKKKLLAEGLFEQSRKRVIPQYPKTIGVVTSQSGAVIHDIITTSASRYTADILLAPAMVQGEGAADSIVAGIELLNKAGVDVIIVGRGGGSIEDLWPFNEEKVARAIYSSAAPVVSAVGHETDFTIADFVADLRAPTPTGAAALILRDKNEIRSQVGSFSLRLELAINNIMQSHKHSFDVLDTRLDPQNALDDIDMRRLQIDDLSRTLAFSFNETVRSMRSRFDLLDARLKPDRALEDIDSLREDIEGMVSRISADAGLRVERCSARLDTIGQRPEIRFRSIIDSDSGLIDAYQQRLEGLNPMKVLTRGYSMITGPDGRAITSAERINVGDTVTIRMRDGSATAGIKTKEMEL